MNVMRAGLCLVLAVVLSGCGKEGNSGDQGIGQRLTGKEAGQAWTHQFGTVREVKNATGAPSWAIMLFTIPDGGDPCTATYNPGEPQFLVSFKVKELKVQDYDATAGTGTGIALTKAVEKAGGSTYTSHGAFGEARLTKVELEKNLVEGQLDVKANDANYVKGTFTAKICK
jgi:hypothetical protein